MKFTKSTSNILILILVLLLSFQPLNTVVQAEEKEGKTKIYFEYIEKEKLTADQAESLNLEKPTQVLENRLYYLVYEPQLSSENEIQTQNVIFHTFYGVCVGIVLLLAFLLGRKYQKTALLLGLSSLVAIGGYFIAKPIFQSWEDSLNHHIEFKTEREKVLLSSNESLSHKVKNIEGYTYVGYWISDEEIFEEEAKETVKQYEKIEELVYETHYGIDPTLPKGQKKVIDGKKGRVKITYEEVISEGKVIARREIAREVLQAAEAKQIITGTKDLSSPSSSQPEIKPTENDQDLPGDVFIPPVFDSNNSIENNPVNTNDPESKPVKRVYAVVETIAFETEYKEDPELKKGETKIVEGKNGSVKITYEESSLNGQILEVKEIAREILSPSVPKQVITGTKEDVVTTKTYEVVETIPFSTLEREDDTLPKGMVKTVEGRNGERVITYEETWVNGVMTEKREVSRRETPAIDKQVITGTKDVTAPVIDDLANLAIELKETTSITLPQGTDDSQEPVTVRVLGLPADLVYENGQITGAAQVTGEHLIRVIYTDPSGNETVKTFTLSVTSDAEKENNQLRFKAPIQEVALSATVDPALSLDQTTLTDVAAIRWQTAPDTTQVGTVKAVLLVEFNDGSTNTLEVEIKVKRDKQKPTLIIRDVQTNALAHSATVTLELTDPDQTYVRSTLVLSKGDTLVQEVNILDWTQPLQLSNLEYDVEYTIQPKLVYRLTQEDETALEASTRNFILELKRIEIRDIREASLYHYEDNRYVRRTSLENLPTSMENYFVRVDSDRTKPSFLPVRAMREVEKDGVPAIEAEVYTSMLVQEREGEYHPDLRIYVEKVNPQTQGDVYYSFSQLIQAMRNNPEGNFVLGNDVSATEVLNDDTPFILEEFRGTLTGQHQGKQFAIHDLEKPLFGSLNGSTITHLDLKNVELYSNKQADLGALAAVSTNSTLTNITASGQILATHKTSINVGGLVGRQVGGYINQTFFKGSIVVNSLQNQAMNVGGLVGKVENGGRLEAGHTDVQIRVAAHKGNHKIGGIVGFLNHGRANRVIAKGQIINAGNMDGQVGGLVGSLWNNGQLIGGLSEISVHNGYIVYGDKAHTKARIRGVFAAQDKASGVVDAWTQFISQEEAKVQRESYAFEAELQDSGVFEQQHSYHIDYLSLTGAKASHAVAYKNMSKLLPYYNKEWVILQGNKIPEEHKLNRVELLDVVPMVDSHFAINLKDQKDHINKIALHYQDGNVEYLPVRYRESLEHEGLYEYQIVDMDLLYTPENIAYDYQTLVDHLVSELNTVEYFSEAMYQALGLSLEEGEAKMRNLYLEERFNQVKTQLAEHLKNIFSQEALLNQDTARIQQYTARDILNNKEKFLLGLTYLSRWYNISYGDVNIQDLMLYKPDFYGVNASSAVEAILRFAQLGYENLYGKNNVTAYALSRESGDADKRLFDFIDYNRQLFVPNQETNDWFKATSKAYIVETPSLSYPEVSVRLYDRLTKSNSVASEMVLPLLTLSKEGKMYVISNMTTIGFGMFERYLNRKLEQTNLPAYQEAVQNTYRMVDQASVWQRDHLDTWYRILPEAFKPKMLRDVLVWDDYQTAEGWLPGHGDTALSILEFFGPIGRWHVRWNGLGAFATGKETYFVFNRALDQLGSSVFTHEMVHNSDGDIYFLGNGRRQGLGAEVYATGLLQVPEYINHPIVSLNLMFDFGQQADHPNRYHNLNTNRFQTMADVEEYMHGLQDAKYTLDYAEGMAVIAQGKEIQKRWFNKIETVDGVNGANLRRVFTEEEWNEMNLQTINDLIDYDVINKREYGEGKMGRNGYYVVSLFSPIYGTAENPAGPPGDLTVKNTGFELLAAKGYEAGFLPYISNQLKKESVANGEVVLTDTFVFDKIFKGEYPTIKAFKKAMFKERIDQLSRLKSVTIQYQNQSVVVDSYQKLQELMNEAVEMDIRNNHITNNRLSRVNQLKGLLYSAYLKLTDDFRSSIFEQ